VEINALVASTGEVMSSKPVLCDVCNEPITPLGGVAITIKTDPVLDAALYSEGFSSTDFIVLCRMGHHSDDEFLSAGYLPPEWVPSMLRASTLPPSIEQASDCGIRELSTPCLGC
jgi:hypothetical protein